MIIVRMLHKRDILFFIQGGSILAFKVYNPKDELVSKEYTVEEVYQDIPIYTKKDKVLVVDMEGLI